MQEYRCHYTGAYGREQETDPGRPRKDQLQDTVDTLDFYRIIDCVPDVIRPR